MTREQQQAGFWAHAWVSHVESYLRTRPRTGVWLDRRFDGGSVLELAAGSCRDSLYLAQAGWDATASDFDGETHQRLADTLPESNMRLCVEDARALTFADGAFDLSFSNGFWILFEDDADVLELIREQARVTRHTMVALVHNAQNSALRRLFDARADFDSLYGFRWFDRVELQRIVARSGIDYRRISFEKFGGRADSIARVSDVIPIISDNTAQRWASAAYRWQPWRATERIACVIDLA